MIVLKINFWEIWGVDNPKENIKNSWELSLKKEKSNNNAKILKKEMFEKPRDKIVQNRLEANKKRNFKRAIF